MFGRPKDADRVVESRARDRARWLIRDHGDEAEAVIAAKLARPNLGAADRLLYRLTRRELKTLRREHAAATRSRALVIQAPNALLSAWLALFGRKRRGRRRSR